MRKLITLFLIVTMLCTLGVNALAAEVTADGNQSVESTLEYGVDMSYVVTIPDTIAMGADGTGSANITASNVLLTIGSTLDVSVSSDSYTDNKWHMSNVDNESDKLAYAISDANGTIANNDAVLSVTAGEIANGTKSNTLNFTLTDAATKAGLYKDNLTFSIKVTDPFAPGATFTRYLNDHECHDTLEGETHNDSCYTITDTTLTWEELKLTENGYKFQYDASYVTDTSVARFENSYLKSINVKNGVTTIYGYAFDCCTTLTTVTLPESITYIASSAFAGCTALTNITFNGTVEQWNNIEFGESVWFQVPATHVTCSDGIVSIENT